MEPDRSAKGEDVRERIRAIRAENERRHSEIENATADPAVLDALENARRVFHSDPDGKSDEAEKHARSLIVDKTRDGQAIEAAALGEQVGREVVAALKQRRELPWGRPRKPRALKLDPPEPPELKPIDVEALARRWRKGAVPWWQNPWLVGIGAAVASGLIVAALT